MINFFKWIEREYDGESIYVNNNGKGDFLFWEFPVYKNQQLKVYNLLKIYDEDEDYNDINIVWRIDGEEDCVIFEKYESALYDNADDYSLKDWENEFKHRFINDEKLIKFLEENVDKEFKE